tara:strand:- start:302 stop:493 length:192 start_codon:yes stop_codon:yes gene_type:complete
MYDCRRPCAFLFDEPQRGMEGEEGNKSPQDTVSYTGGEPCQISPLEGQGQGGVFQKKLQENWA